MLIDSNCDILTCGMTIEAAHPLQPADLRQARDRCGTISLGRWSLPLTNVDGHATISCEPRGWRDRCLLLS